MDRAIRHQQQNSTLGSCNESLNTVFSLLDNILLSLSFLISVIVIVKLLIRLYNARGFLPSEVFLLQINFANVCLFISQLLLFLESVNVGHFSRTIILVLFSPSLTVRPLFIFAICVFFYIAIVHPVTYRSAKTLHHWKWLVLTLIWIYALAINLAIIINNLDIFHPGLMATFYISILPSIFFYISMLRALTSSGGQTLNPTKKKAVQVIVSILVVTLVYYIPRVYILIYPLIAPMDLQRFLCSEGLVIMLLSKISELLMPLIYLYSLSKVEM